MRSHMTAFGLGAGLVLLAGGVLAIAGPRFIDIDDERDGVSVVNLEDGDSGSFQLKDGKLAVAAKWKGDFEFAGDARSLTSLAKSLEVEVEEGGAVRKAVFENKDGKIVVSAFKNDAALAGADADAEAAALLQTFARSSGVNAGQRLKAIIAEGGKAAAIAEIGALTGGHAAGAYIGALAEIASLDDKDVDGLAERIADLKSDFAKRQALASLLEHQKLGESGLQAVLVAAKTIESDHEVRLIIEALSESAMSGTNAAAATALLADIESDHEIRLAVEALVESKALAGADAARAVAAAAAAIDGDYEKRLVIEAAAERLKDAGMAAATIAAADAIEGAHERRLAIDTIAESLDTDSPHWLALIGLAEGIDGDHERRLAVETLADLAPRNAEIKAALAEAAASIGSDHDRRLAQDALN